MCSWIQFQHTEQDYLNCIKIYYILLTGYLWFVPDKIESKDEEYEKMISRNIILRSQKETMEFVDIVAQYPYSVEVSLGKETMDAKSVLGMLALGFNRVMQMNIQSDHAEDLLEAVSKFLCTQFGQAV